MYTTEQYNAFSKHMEEKFPAMFSGQYGGFAVSQGWWPIIETLCANIQSHTDWKNKQRERELVRHEAYTKGYDSMLKFYQGKSAEPSEWDEKNARVTMEEGVEVPTKVPQVEVHQIKEKFGGLRFYYEGGDDQISGMVRMAEAWADTSCEECGAIGKRRSGGWIRTLCDVHEAERQERLKENGN